jgi:alpha-ketoglutarate-dependent taurine dioxygenase
MVASVTIEPLPQLFGAEVHGLVPELPLDEATLASLRRAFDEHSLLLVRDFDCDARFQDYLSQALIGNEAGVAGVLAGENPFYMHVSNKEERGGVPYGSLRFHTDMMWAEDAFRLISLYGLDVEQPAVPTQFISTHDAWDRLPEQLRARVAGLQAEHGREASGSRRQVDPDLLVASFPDEATVAMPVVHKHPRTGRTMLYLSEQMTHRIAGMDPEESEDLLEELFAHMAQPDAVVSHLWRKGDLVLWDNLALQHARPNVRLDGPARTLRKVYGPHPVPGASARPTFARAGDMPERKRA